MKAGFLQLFGMIAIVGGIAVWSIPAAIVTAGIGLLAAGIIVDLKEPPHGPVQPKPTGD